MFHNIFETHAHYDEDCYAPTLHDTLLEQHRLGVQSIINCGFNIASSRRSVALAEHYAFVYAAVGVFPLEAEGLPENWQEEIESLARQPKVVAIGEIGLDYHSGKEKRDVQSNVFVRQMELARDMGLPIQVHTRDADADTIALLQTHKPRGLIHRFASSPKAGSAYLDLGMYLGIGCNITYPAFSHVLETVRSMPLERLVLETDSPFLPPAWMAGQITASDTIVYVAKAVAEARGDVSPQEVLNITCENASKLFLNGRA